jgi:hypothetical protein
MALWRVLAQLSLSPSAHRLTSMSLLCHQDTQSSYHHHRPPRDEDCPKHSWEWGLLGQAFLSSDREFAIVAPGNPQCPLADTRKHFLAESSLPEFGGGQRGTWIATKSCLAMTRSQISEQCYFRDSWLDNRQWAVSNAIENEMLEVHRALFGTAEEQFKMSQYRICWWVHLSWLYLGQAI